MKIICIGRNYSEHIAELANERPEEPVVFIKPDSAVLRNNAPFFHPEFTEEIHYEAELVLRINKVGKHIAPEFAHTYYDAITLGIDFTARDLQNKLKAKGLPWERAKGFDHSAVLGKFIPVPEKDMQDIRFSLSRNDEKVQDGHTAQMLWGVHELIAYVSQYFTLKKGDLLFTGTPSGVGKIHIDDQFVGELEGQEVFRFNVK